MYTMDISERLHALGHNTNCCRKCQNQQQHSAQKYVTKAESMDYESPLAVCAVHNSASCDTTFTCQLNVNKHGTTDSNSNSSRQQNLSLRRLYALVLFLTLFANSYGCGPGRGIGGPRRSRKLTPLVVNEHMPMKPEKTHGASGSSEGVITRHSPKFKDLVMNYNHDIVFKDEEGTGADRLMSRRCKEKLNILSVSVMNQWPGVRLRVIESWDEDNSHENNSLHYEGRAVDITTSDCDRSKYGMLARLAVESGFDWVYYKSRAHIHCSVKSDAMHPTHMSGCFTPESTVITESGASKLMSDLRIGDRVLSMNDKGEPVYSEVILFMDRNMEQMQDFVKIGTEDGAVLIVTPAHLILTWNPKKGLMDYVFAEDIEENDFVLVRDAHGSLSPQRVVKLSAVVRKGVVAPLTAEGTIVVNSVAASCYAIVKSQSLAHWSMAPVRLIAKLESWLPSKTNAVSSTQSNEIVTPKLTTTQQQNGVHWYARMLYTLKDYVLPRSWRYQ